MSFRSQFYMELTGVVTIVAIINVWLLVPTGIVFLFFYLIRTVFLKSARDVKRIEAISKINRIIFQIHQIQQLF